MFNLMQFRCPACHIPTALTTISDALECLECGWSVESLLEGIHAHQRMTTDPGERQRLAERGRGAVLALVDTGLITDGEARRWVARFASSGSDPERDRVGLIT